MKKAMFLTTILALLIFVGCGSDNKEEKNTDTGDTTADSGSSDADTDNSLGDTGSSGAEPSDNCDTNPEVDTEPEYDASCILDSSLLAADENGGAYFAFKGIGKINSDVFDHEPADPAKISFGFSDIYGKQFFSTEHVFYRIRRGNHNTNLC